MQALKTCFVSICACVVLLRDHAHTHTQTHTHADTHADTHTDSAGRVWHSLRLSVYRSDS